MQPAAPGLAGRAMAINPSVLASWVKTRSRDARRTNQRTDCRKSLLRLVESRTEKNIDLRHPQASTEAIRFRRTHRRLCSCRPAGFGEKIFSVGYLGGAKTFFTVKVSQRTSSLRNAILGKCLKWNKSKKTSQEEIAYEPGVISSLLFVYHCLLALWEFLTGRG